MPVGDVSQLAVGSSRGTKSSRPERSIVAVKLDREYIVAEIRRTAEENGGKPLGRVRFAAQTGIREADCQRYWARWNDAVREAGLEPNQLQDRYDDEAVLSRLVPEIQRLGRMPTRPELSLLRREDSTFPAPGVFERLGSTKLALASRVADFCRVRPECADVLEIVTPLLVTEGQEASDA